MCVCGTYKAGTCLKKTLFTHGWMWIVQRAFLLLVTWFTADREVAVMGQETKQRNNKGINVRNTMYNPWMLAMRVLKKNFDFKHT